MVLRVVRLGVIGLAIVYAIGLGVIYAKQRDFIFDRQFSSVLARPGTVAIAGSTRVTIPTRDGEKLAGWYLPPSEKGGPVFLFFHGKGGALERKKWRWQRIAKKGAGILAFSYRGFPGSTGLPSEDGLYEDARAAYAWLSEKHKPSEIVLHGLSLGTGVAAKLATEVKARALVLEAPYAALVDVAAERHPYFPVSFLLWDQFRTEEFIADIKVPLLIVHGDQDTAIPLDHARKLFRLAPEPKKLVVMKGSDHNTLTRDGMYPRIWKFLENLAKSVGSSASAHKS
ncbi:MAG: alpha/beta hydrolase [Filomicrobium sp.]